MNAPMARIATTDVEVIKSAGGGKFRAIVQRHDMPGEPARFDVFVDRHGVDLAACANPDDLMALGSVLRRASMALADAQRKVGQ
ncbi:hypothetical protein ACAG26_06840 [Mycobacterium sp. pUA109]|uniref:hypothetical protein n=1 Tax=Mycobacterium sp. pUA109 TaxID=3238982 RepID=UPI00351B792F